MLFVLKAVLGEAPIAIIMYFCEPIIRKFRIYSSQKYINFDCETVFLKKNIVW